LIGTHLPGITPDLSMGSGVGEMTSVESLYSLLNTLLNITNFIVCFTCIRQHLKSSQNTFNEEQWTQSSCGPVRNTQQQQYNQNALDNTCFITLSYLFIISKMTRNCSELLQNKRPT